MENIEQLSSRLGDRYGNPEAAFLARAGIRLNIAPAAVPAAAPAEVKKPVSKVANVARTKVDLKIRNEADWEKATAKLKDIQSIASYISESAYKDREKLSKMLQKYIEDIEKKMVCPEDEDERCAEIWLSKVQNILKKRFNTLRIVAHRMNQMPLFQHELQHEIKKYFFGLGMHECTFKEGTMISGQEEWFDILPYPNDDERLNISIKEIELQPYYVMYFDNEEENVEQAVKRFIFPGQAWVYEKKKEA